MDTSPFRRSPYRRLAFAIAVTAAIAAVWVAHRTSRSMTTPSTLAAFDPVMKRAGENKRAAVGATRRGEVHRHMKTLLEVANKFTMKDANASKGQGTFIERCPYEFVLPLA